MKELDLARVPDHVRTQAEQAGLAVEQVYADYLDRREREKAIARAADDAAIERTPGCPRGSGYGRFYSVDEMKSMSRNEVRSRYGSLMDSLKRGIEKFI